MVYQTLLGQGLRIPDDVAVIGYDNMVGIGELFLPPLTTVQLPHYEIGRLSALHIINGEEHQETTRVESPFYCVIPLHRQREHRFLHLPDKQGKLPSFYAVQWHDLSHSFLRLYTPGK